LAKKSAALANYSLMGNYAVKRDVKIVFLCQILSEMVEKNKPSGGLLQNRILLYLAMQVLESTL